MGVSVTNLESAYRAHTHCFYLLGSSLVVLIASGMACQALGSCTKEFGWAVAASTISTAMTLFLALASIFSNGEGLTYDRLGGPRTSWSFKNGKTWNESSIIG